MITEKSSSKLPVGKYKDKLKAAEEFIEGRSKGLFPSLTTSMPSLNRCLFDGFE